MQYPQKKHAIARAIAQHRNTLLAGATATALMIPTQAMSQALEEVLVTAQKRESNLQDTSLSVQVLGEDALRELNVTGFDDYVQYLPTVSFTSTRPGISQVYMRGINSGGDGNHSGAMPSVAVYLDEQPITTINEVLDLHMYDIARVETLAGPQGTLFGSSSQAGTLRIITNKPTNEFQASYDLTGNQIDDGGSGFTLEGMVNVPMGDSVALRLVGWYDDAPGYIDNVFDEITYDGPGTTINNRRFVEDDFNETETTGARAALRIDLNEDWAITPGITYQKMDSDGAFDHDPDDLGELETSKFYDTFYDEEWYQASLTVEGRIGGLDLVYAGAYLDRDRESQYDYSWYAEYYDNVTRPDYNDVYCGYECWVSYHYDSNGDPVESSQYVDQDENWNRESHEIRLQSQEGRLRWIAGFFYQEQEHDFDLRWTAPAVGDDVTLVPGGPTVVWQTVQTRNDEEMAVFGEMSFDITDNLTVLGGLRWYDYENSLYGFNGWYGRCTGFFDENGDFVEDRDNGTLQSPCYDTGILDDTSSNDDVIGKVNVSYTLDEDKLLYFTWSEGYRPGGVNRALEGSPYEEDFVTNWEAGWKTVWMEGRMRFNGAVYFMDWEDFQYASLDLGSGQPLTIINNAGQAEVYGLEFDTDFAISQAFTFSFSGSYIDAATSEEFDHPDETIPDGTKMPYTPEWQMTSILRYATQLGEFDVYGQGAWTYSDGSDTDLRPSYARSIDSYNLFNLGFGVARNSWHVDFFIDNVTDERAELDNVDSYPLYDGNIRSATFFGVNQPRTYGLRFGQRF